MTVSEPKHVHVCNAQSSAHHKTCVCSECGESYPNTWWDARKIERAEPSRGALEARCAVCGWPLAETRDKGCRPGDCSVRPLPTIAYDTDRANREYTAFWGERSSRRWDEPAISENEKLRSGRVVLLEALRHTLPILIGAIAFVDCKAVVAEVRAAIKQAERT